MIEGKIKVHFPGGSVIKNLPVKQEAQVLSLGQEDPPLINQYKRRAIKHFTLHWKSKRVRLILVMLKLFLRAQGS